MGTFHNDKSPLHGITVVVDTADDSLWVGRCHDEDAQRVILLDADVHQSHSDASREEWLSKASRFGVWGRHKSVVIPREQVVSLRRLGEVGSETDSRESASA